VSDLHGFPSQDAYDKAKAEQAAAAEKPRARRAYEDVEIIVCAHCRAERRKRKALARKTKTTA